MCGRGVEGVCGSWRRPRLGVLVPDVERTGLPLTELLPYTKIETKEIKKKNIQGKSTKKRQEEKAGGWWSGRGHTETRTRRSGRRRSQKNRMENGVKATATGGEESEGRGRSRETTKKGKNRKERNTNKKRNEKWSFCKFQGLKSSKKL